MPTPGHSRDTSGTLPGHFRDTSGTLPGHFRDWVPNSGSFCPARPKMGLNCSDGWFLGSFCIALNDFAVFGGFWRVLAGSSAFFALL